MNSDMQKALANLIDETLGEIEELKKSDRFSASEVSLGDSKSGIKDADKDGKLDKEEDKKDEEKEDDKDEEKEDKKDEEKEDDVEKAQGVNEESDPMSKMEDRMSKMEDVMSKMESYMSKKEDKEDDEDEDSKEDKKEDEKELKKSTTESLEKSASDRIETLEKSLENISDMIKKIADAPVPSQSVSYKNVKPLMKSEDAVQPLTKSEVVEKLFELKKSGTIVNSVDITSAELANPFDLAKIASKYNIN